MLNAFELQKTLVKAAMPSGYESRCGEAIAEIAKPFCDEMWFTPTGSLVCHKKGSGKKLILLFIKKVMAKSLCLPHIWTLSAIS